MNSQMHLDKCDGHALLLLLLVDVVVVVAGFDFPIVYRYFILKNEGSKRNIHLILQLQNQ